MNAKMTKNPHSNMNRVELLFYNIYLYFRFGLKKRDKHTLLFGSWFGEKFADNSRFLFQYLADNKKKHRINKVVWATRSEKLFNELKTLGYEVVMIGTEESDYYHKTSGVHIVCNAGASFESKKGDIDGKYSYGAIRINLWHGLPGKGVDYASLEYKTREKSHPFLMKLYYYMIKIKPIRALGFQPGGWNDAYRLSTTPFVTDLFIDMTKLPASYIIESGYPRNYPVSKLLPEENRIIKLIKESSFTILYLPTFRDNKVDYQNPLDDLSIVQWINDENVLWIQKPHSANRSMLNTRTNNRNMFNLPDTFDINTLLPHIDVVLTDYSSVCFDAMYHNKPVVYYVPDLKQYMESDRGFVISPNEFLAGPKSSNTEELLMHLKSVRINRMREMPPMYYSFREKIWNYDKKMEDVWEDICKKTGI